MRRAPDVTGAGSQPRYRKVNTRQFDHVSYPFVKRHKEKHSKEIEFFFIRNSPVLATAADKIDPNLVSAVDAASGTRQNREHKDTHASHWQYQQRSEMQARPTLTGCTRAYVSLL